LPSKKFPKALYRVRHSAKALPSTNKPLPSASSTRQRGRIRYCRCSVNLHESCHCSNREGQI
jgi:hypothetical protein